MAKSKRSEQAHRKRISCETVVDVISQVRNKVAERLSEKGLGSFSSRHEILGIIEEEKYELMKAVHEEDLQGVKRELIDQAVGCIFAIACIDEKALDW